MDDVKDKRIGRQRTKKLRFRGGMSGLPWVRSKDGGNKDFHCDKGRQCRKSSCNFTLFHGERLRLPRSSSNQSHDGHMAAATVISRIYAQ